MNILEQKISLSWLMDRAEMSLPERLVRGWWGDAQEHTLAEILDAEQVSTEHLLWLCLRLPVPPVAHLHSASLEMALSLAMAAEKEGVFVDRRSLFALSKKRKWIHGDISLGELTQALRRAEAAMHDLSELGGLSGLSGKPSNQEAALRVARAICEAGSPDSERAVLSFYKTIQDHPVAEKGQAMRRHLIQMIRSKEKVS